MTKKIQDNSIFLEQPLQLACKKPKHKSVPKEMKSKAFTKKECKAYKMNWNNLKKTYDKIQLKSFDKSILGVIGYMFQV